MLRKILVIAAVCFSFSSVTYAQGIKQSKGNFEDKFRQLDEILPTANIYRNAGGEPGHKYWQQRADYTINATLDENKKRISGTVKIKYHNNSPDTLRFLWVQLDQNVFDKNSKARLSRTTRSAPSKGLKGFGSKSGRLSLGQLRAQHVATDIDYGFDISFVKDGSNKALKYTLVGTKMRIDLKKPLRTGKTVTFSIKYAYNIINNKVMGGRNGYEHFPKDEIEGGGYIYLIAQWYPRMGAYTDYEAWTAKEFLGTGEFTQEFGDFDVKLTVPADHIVAATGELENSSSVLTSKQRSRLKKSRTSKRPVLIVTDKEALENEKEGTNKTKTWHFKAKNVRDFAWASSRKFIWDAKGVKQTNAKVPLVMAMSYWPKEGGDLWKKYSTEVVEHTIDVYSRVTFKYPYPVIISVNGPVGGMEYPMITFNGPRTVLHKDGTRTYTKGAKNFLIGVVIHEVGHMYYPMIINSDERQWAWMDEGLNSYMDSVAGREWDPSDRPNEPSEIIDYMKGEVQVPIMTQSDSILRYGPNAYTKPATALNILRETILGNELFDFAFKEYARRWKFKRPTPADFFRTMEEASGIDLDWFWRGWFYSTDHVDISLDYVYKMEMGTKNPDIDFENKRKVFKKRPASLFVENYRKKGMQSWVERNPDVSDFYDKNDNFTVTNKDRNSFNSFIKGLKPWEKTAYEHTLKENKSYYVLEMSNKGGLVMPIILGLTYKDGSTEIKKLPVEIWRKSPFSVKKLLVLDKELSSIVIDPRWETADVNIENNYYPRRMIPSRVEIYKRPARKAKNLMHESKTKLKSDEDDKKEDDKKSGDKKSDNKKKNVKKEKAKK